MPVSYTNRKGQTYTLYQGQTKSGKPRYYFGKTDQSQGVPVTEIPPGFTISESVNGVVSLAKDKPSLIMPEEVTAVEAIVRQHPDSGRYRVVVKQNRIEIYEQASNYSEVLKMFSMSGEPSSHLTEQVRAMEDRHAQFAPVLRFTLLDSAQRSFGAERMCYRSSVDGWLELYEHSGSVEQLAQALVPTLGTDEFFELF